MLGGADERQRKLLPNKLYKRESGGFLALAYMKKG
jgi:hypothetical protein